MRAALKASFGSPMPAEFTAGERIRSHTSWTNPETMRLAPTPMNRPNVEDRRPRSMVRAVLLAADRSTRVFKYKELLRRSNFAITNKTTPKIIRSSRSFLRIDRESTSILRYCIGGDFNNYLLDHLGQRFSRFGSWQFERSLDIRVEC